MKDQTKKIELTDNKRTTPTEKALLLGSDEVIAKAIQDLLRKDSQDKSWN